MERRLLAVAEKAMSNVADAVDEGNLSAWGLDHARPAREVRGHD